MDPPLRLRRAGSHTAFVEQSFHRRSSGVPLALRFAVPPPASLRPCAPAGGQSVAFVHQGASWALFDRSITPLQIRWMVGVGLGLGRGEGVPRIMMSAIADVVWGMQAPVPDLWVPGDTHGWGRLWLPSTQGCP